MNDFFSRSIFFINFIVAFINKMDEKSEGVTLSNGLTDNNYFYDWRSFYSALEFAAVDHT